MSQRFSFGTPSGGEYKPTLSFILMDETTQRETPILTAIVDTGADGTIIPIAVLQAAGFKPNRQRKRLVPAQTTAVPEIVPGYLVNLRIDDFELFDVDVYGSRTINEIILGRNVLNKLTFFYAGPKRYLELIQE